jgi:exosortase A-associated hydrolase 1
MRRLVSFTCEGNTLAATLDEAPSATGLLIVSGGNEIRAGAHRGMAKLAADIAAKGFPVFRFDRRGIGDSEGQNRGFQSSALDIDAAISAFRGHCPAITRIVAFGNCDGASAILIHRPAGIDAALLANIWTIETNEEGPPPAAIKARYKEKLLQPKEWLRLLRGGINIGKVLRGLTRIASPVPLASLSASIAHGLESFPGPIDILVSKGDATAIAFTDEWSKPHFKAARSRNDIKITQIDSRSHSFASAQDYDALFSAACNALLRAS